MICKACKKETEIEFNNLCQECINIAEDIAIKKLESGEDLPPAIQCQFPGCQEKMEPMVGYCSHCQKVISGEAQEV